MQVRYQAAPRSDTLILFVPRLERAAGELAARHFANHTLFGDSGAAASAPQDPHQLLELDPQLLDDLLTLRDVRASLLARKLVARATDREALIVEETADLTDDDNVLPLVVAAIAPALDRLELREFLLPIAQHVRLHAAQLTHLPDGEVTLARDDRQLRVILWLQHRLRPVP